MNGLALCTIYIGISGALNGGDTLIMIISVAIGALIGEIIDIDKWLNKLGYYLEGKFKNKSLQNTLMFLSNIELNLINTGGKFNYCNNVDIKTNVNDIEFNDCINVKVGDLD